MRFTINSQNDQLPVGLIVQLAGHCTGAAGFWLQIPSRAKIFFTKSFSWKESGFLFYKDEQERNRFEWNELPAEANQGLDVGLCQMQRNEMLELCQEQRYLLHQLLHLKECLPLQTHQTCQHSTGDLTLLQHYFNDKKDNNNNKTKTFRLQQKFMKEWLRQASILKMTLLHDERFLLLLCATLGSWAGLHKTF